MDNGDFLICSEPAGPPQGLQLPEDIKNLLLLYLQVLCYLIKTYIILIQISNYFSIFNDKQIY